MDVLADHSLYVMTREQSFAQLRGFLPVIAINEEPTTVSVQVTARTQPGVAHEQGRYMLAGRTRCRPPRAGRAAGRPPHARAR